MNEQTIRRLMENLGFDAEDIEDAVSDWAEDDRQERSDRAAAEEHA